MPELQPGDIIGPNYIKRASWWQRPVTRRTALLQTAGGILAGVGGTRAAEFLGSSDLPVVGGFSKLQDQKGNPLTDKFVTGNELKMVIVEQPGLFTSIDRLDVSYDWQGTLQGAMGGWPIAKSFSEPTYTAEDNLKYYVYTLSLSGIPSAQEFQVGINVYGRQLGIPKKRLGTPFETFVKN